MQRGSTRRVGDGCDIKVFKDPWLLGARSYVTSPVVIGLEEMSVNSLMCTGRQRWDVDVVNDLFHPVEASLILNIPLIRGRISDAWMWKWEKKGLFLVKSGYKELSRDIYMVHRGGHHQSATWRLIWSVPVPPKVKCFLWRACTCAGTLPTKQNLISRKADVSEVCPVCCGGSESVFHILISYTFAKECWSMSSVGLYVIVGQSCSFVEWLEVMLRGLRRLDAR